MPSPRYWREIPGRYRLEAARCEGCGHVHYPARRLCPECRRSALTKVPLSRRGKVITSTVIHVPPADLLMEAPYVMALVETPEGVRFMTQVVDCEPEAIHPGTEVTLEFRRVRKEGHGGILAYGHKAVPAS